MRAPRPRIRTTLVACLACAGALLLLPAVSPATRAQRLGQPSAGQPPVTTSTTTAATMPAATNPMATNATATQTPAVGVAVSASATGTPITGDEQILINTDLITVNVTLTDTYGRYVTGLSKEAFTVLDDKLPQEITFFSDDDAPVSLGVIFDVSGSMGRDKIMKARDALSHFVDTSHEGDEYFLIGFNQRAQVLMDRTRDSDALLAKLTFVQTKGQTALYDACYLGVEKVTRGTHPKRAVLVISDGQDNSSRYTFGELRKMLKETDVLIYAIGINDGGDLNSGLGAGGQAILEELASVSGGKAFFPNTSADMNDIFERIAIELRHQYSIGYRPSNFTNDGKYHKLKVKVTPPRGLPRLTVRSKDGYYATTQPR